MKLKYIPNILSSIRILLVFVFIYVFFFSGENNYFWAAIIFLAAGATDVIDGFLARRFNWITNLGKLLDPLADKLMQCTVLICLWIDDILPWWLIFPFILKEFLMLLGGLLMLKRRSVVVSSNKIGKFAVLLFYAAVVIIILKGNSMSAATMNTLLLVAFAMTVTAMVVYVYHYAKKASEIKKERNNMIESTVTKAES